MKIELQKNWISEKLFDPANLGNPLIADIQSFEQVKTPKGKDNLLTIKLKNNKLYEMSVYGDNLNVLIATFGDETDLWKDKKIKIMLLTNASTGKKEKRLYPMSDALPLAST